LGIEEETTAAILFWFVTELVWMCLEDEWKWKGDEAWRSQNKCQYVYARGPSLCHELFMANTTITKQLNLKPPKALHIPYNMCHHHPIPISGWEVPEIKKMLKKGLPMRLAAVWGSELASHDFSGSSLLLLASKVLQPHGSCSCMALKAN
jgi:hypothetical protein